MGVPFKKIPRRDPRKEDAVAKFYPQLVTLGDNADLEDVAYVISLSARTIGVEKKEDCTAKNIKAVKINFRPSTTIRPDVTATRAGQKIDFYDLEALVNKDGSSSGGNSSGDQGGSGSGEGGLDENPLG